MGRTKERGAQNTQLVRCCVVQVSEQADLVDMLALKIIKKLDHLGIFLGVAGLQQKTNWGTFGLAF